MAWQSLLVRHPWSLCCSTLAHTSHADCAKFWHTVPVPSHARRAMADNAAQCDGRAATQGSKSSRVLSQVLPLMQMAERGIGFVGDITSIKPDLISTLVEGGYIPVVASVAADYDGQALNVNADIAAGEVSKLSAHAGLMPKALWADHAAPSASAAVMSKVPYTGHAAPPASAAFMPKALR